MTAQSPFTFSFSKISDEGFGALPAQLHERLRPYAAAIKGIYTCTVAQSSMALQSQGYTVVHTKGAGSTQRVEWWVFYPSGKM